MGEPAQHVILYYKYVDIPDPEAMCAWHAEVCSRLLGRVLISKEGINGTLSGTEEDIMKYCAAMEDHPIFQMTPDDWKRSVADEIVFPDLKLKAVKEIVSTGGIIPKPSGESWEGSHLSPSEFHEELTKSLTDDNVVLLDVRSRKEFQIGHFEGAIDPACNYFSEYPKFMDDHLGEMKDKKVLMYCTGGIRCEKASRYLRSKGVEEVHQLKGGIHKYMDAFPDGGHFRGKNFIFDKRVAMASTDTTVVGKCFSCEAPFDEMKADRLCTVCRTNILVCDSCVEALHGEYHCEDHVHLKSCYFTNLARFSPDELRAQQKELQKLLAGLDTGRGGKNRRRTLRRQIEKIDTRLAELDGEGGTSSASAAAAVVCRTCARDQCTGSCWGFWKAGGAESNKRQKADSEQAAVAAH